MKIRTRIAPSPTGSDIHIGNLYTALINWTFARKHNGSFIVRIEDTDRQRYIDGAEEQILRTLKTFGLNHDEGPDIGGPHGPYRQSERKEMYQKYAEELVEKGTAYYSFCTKDDLARMREEKLELKKELRKERYAAFDKKTAEKRIAKGEEYVIRLLVPENEDITFHDIIRGDITFNTRQIDDQVLLKSDGFPTYHLAVVVDDYMMEISHVIRAEEWISSTPKHVLLYRAFGWDLPAYAHNPILRNPDKSKLSKRKNPVWASWYMDHGFLPQAMLNYLALMGWSHPDQIEVFSMKEFQDRFDLKDMAPVGPAFDQVKLSWMNGVYIRNMSADDLFDRIMLFYKNRFPGDTVQKSVPLIQERIKTISEYEEMCEFFFKEPTEYQKDITSHSDLLRKMATHMNTIKTWTATSIGEEMMNLATEEGVKNKVFFEVLRIAITGKKISPPLNESMEILGKETCIQRVQKAAI